MSKFIKILMKVIAGGFLLVVVLLVVTLIISTRETKRQAQAFYESAKQGMTLEEALEKNPDWSNLFLGGNDCDYQINYKRSEGVYVLIDKKVKDHVPVSYSTLRDLFQANPQFFMRCSRSSVYYHVGMERGFARVTVEIESQGKIVLAKEPYYED